MMVLVYTGDRVVMRISAYCIWYVIICSSLLYLINYYSLSSYYIIIIINSLHPCIYHIPIIHTYIHLHIRLVLPPVSRHGARDAVHIV